MDIFKQDDFSGGMNQQLDATKSPENSFPLLINGRIRRNVISPTNKHVLLGAPAGNFQGLYVEGSTLILFVSGLAYYADITQNPIIFRPVAPWNAMSSTSSRIYAELAPASSNLFYREGNPDAIARTFPGTVAVFPQGLFVFDGVTQSQVIFADGTSVPLGTFASWTKDNPSYVPIGVLPAFASNKLFVADPTRKLILQSVSGRPSDFMVNITNDGSKGGEANTVSQTVSYNDITAIRALSTGQVLIGTLYGTHALELDYNNTIFGEPDLIPLTLFPAGPINELSIIDILQDTAFITQSGIHAFNAVAQSKRESNNYPLGARIRGLLTDPDTGKSITQADTCAGLYDDYAFFAVNTIHGYGCIVYDTISEAFQSLDLSFGRVKQFATTRIDGVERLFFITHDNQIFEAFASEQKNPTRVYLGEWTPDAAGMNSLTTLYNLMFSTVRTSGQCKLSIYSDRELIEDPILEVTAPGFTTDLPIPIPFTNKKQSVPVNFQTDKVKGWKIGLLIEWNFDGDLTHVSVDGQVQSADNVDLDINVPGSSEQLAIIGSSGYSDELAPAGSFGVDGYVLVSVVKGSRYAYLPNTNGDLINGAERVTEGIFTAVQDTVVVFGTGTISFSLRTAERYMSVIQAIQSNAELTGPILHAGGFAFPSGAREDVEIARLGLRRDILVAPGTDDQATSSGLYLFNLLQQPRYGIKTFNFVDFFLYNSDPSEPDGIDELSLQAGLLRNWANESTKPFKIVLCYRPPYSTNAAYYPGVTDLQWLNKIVGINAVISGGGAAYERYILNDFPYITIGNSGQPFGSFQPATSSSFRDNTTLGYLHVTADALTCLLEFKDINGNVIDSFALYT